VTGSAGRDGSGAATGRGTGAAAPPAATLAGRFSMKERMSFLVTRLWIPVPSISRISTPFSCAIFRTSGEERVRTRSSKDSIVPPCADTGGGGAAGGLGAAGGGAALGGGGGAAAAASEGLGGGGGGAAGAGLGGSAFGGSAAFAAGGGAAPGCSPASPIRATTVLMATVCPSATLTSKRV